MAETIRQKVFDEIESLASQILVANGYNYDIGNTVIMERSKFHYSMMPCMILVPGLEVASKAYGNQVLTIDWQGFGVVPIPEDRDMIPQVANKVLGGMILGLIGQRLSNSVLEDRIYQQGGLSEYPDDGEVALPVTIQFQVVYHTVLGDPFTKA